MPTNHTDITLTDGQATAIELASHWYKNFSPDDQPIFVVSGFAGTGKTFLIRHLMEELGLDAIYAAYTGKAALVMSKLNDISARTCHSLIYRPKEPDKAECERLFTAIKSASSDGEKKDLQQALREAQKIKFELRDDSDLHGADILNLDECSMVNDEMKTDLVRFKTPIIALGDPGQLPPIEGTGALFRGEPDVLLTEIMRQAADNPIIDMTVRARKGIPFQYCREGAARRLDRNELSIEDMAEADQVLCGKNATRRMLNAKMRLVHNRRDVYPEPGDKLICLRNNAEMGLFNGLMAEVVERGDLTDNAVKLKIKSETRPNSPQWIEALRAHFDIYHDKDALEGVRWWQRKDTEEFDFGYAITVHKAQGSQYENVVLYDDKFGVWDKALRRQWLYTAVSRAAETITVLQ